MTFRRITFKRNVPNPYFLYWLKVLYRDAEVKSSKLRFILKEALIAMSNYPLPLQSGAECAILKGFESMLCRYMDIMLERQIKMQKTNVHSPVPESNMGPDIDASVECTVAPSSPIISPKTKMYKPAFRSGGYSILITLLENINSLKKTLTKKEIIALAQEHCDEYFVRHKPNSYYTAWSSMNCLIKKGLVLRHRRKQAEFELSTKGIIVAKKLLKESKNNQSINDVINEKIAHIDSECVTNEVCEAISNVEDPSLIDMQAGSFDIILLIDKQETSGLSKSTDSTIAQFKKYPDVLHEYRHLKVGDYTWIARHKTNKNLELVLPYIVERKRIDDLGSSIKDGRFHEQKFRLRKCGIQNVIYLVEHYGTNKHVGLPMQSLMQAIVNTRAQDGFKIHITNSFSESVRFLIIMSKRLNIEYKNKHLQGLNAVPSDNMLMSFEFFSQLGKKNKSLTVTETFIKMLVQLNRLSVEKALAITEVYKTPNSLIRAYNSSTRKEGEKLLGNLKHGMMNKTVGPSISYLLHQLFTSENLQ